MESFREDLVRIICPLIQELC